MAKNMIWLWIAIAFIVVVGMTIQNKYDIFSVIGSDVSVSKDTTQDGIHVCENTVDEFTLGATATECYMYTIGNEKSIRYVNSITQTGPTQGPTGERYVCNYDIGTPSSSNVCKDGKIYTSPGVTINYCDTDSQCAGYVCTSHYCSNNAVGTCPTIGAKKCYTFSGNNNQFETCLSNNIWSGIQTCGGGLVCSLGDCVAPCTESNWQSSLSECTSFSTQTKTWTKVGNCATGVSHPATEAVSCTYVVPTPPACTSHNYGEWSTCSVSGARTRTLLSSVPSNCAAGTPTVTSEACTYIPVVPCTPNWQTTNWSICTAGTQLRAANDLNNCGVTTGMPALSQTCTMPNTACTTDSNCLTGQECVASLCQAKAADKVCTAEQTNFFGTCLDTTTFWIILAAVGGLIILLVVGKK